MDVFMEDLVRNDALQGKPQILVIIYHVLSTRKPYYELGADSFEQQDQARLTQRSVRQLEALGYMVTLTPQEAA
jgi:transposase